GGFADCDRRGADLGLGVSRLAIDGDAERQFFVHPLLAAFTDDLLDAALSPAITGGSRERRRRRAGAALGGRRSRRLGRGLVGFIGGVARRRGGGLRGLDRSRLGRRPVALELGERF